MEFIFPKKVFEFASLEQACNEQIQSIWETPSRTNRSEIEIVSWINFRFLVVLVLVLVLVCVKFYFDYKEEKNGVSQQSSKIVLRCVFLIFQLTFFAVSKKISSYTILAIFLVSKVTDFFSYHTMITWSNSDWSKRRWLVVTWAKVKFILDLT